MPTSVAAAETGFFEGLPPKVLGAVQTEHAVASRTFSQTPARGFSASATTHDWRDQPHKGQRAAPRPSAPTDPATKLPHLTVQPRMSLAQLRPSPPLEDRKDVQAGCIRDTRQGACVISNTRSSEKTASRRPCCWLWAPQSHSSCLEPPPALGPEDTTPDTDLVPFTSPAELGWFGPSDICSLGQDGPAAAPQSPGHYALSPGIHPAEQRSTGRCLGS